MTSRNFAIKAALTAMIVGGVGGVASHYFDSAPATATQSLPVEPWRPTRNMIGRAQPMSAADLDRQQPSGERAETVPRKAQGAALGVSAWSYRGCRKARAAGAVPLLRGQPGYGAHMDGDGDGIACKDYHR